MKQLITEVHYRKSRMQQNLTSANRQYFQESVQALNNYKTAQTIVENTASKIQALPEEQAQGVAEIVGFVLEQSMQGVLVEEIFFEQFDDEVNAAVHGVIMESLKATKLLSESARLSNVSEQTIFESFGTMEVLTEESSAESLAFSNGMVGPAVRRVMPNSWSNKSLFGGQHTPASVASHHAAATTAAGHATSGAATVGAGHVTAGAALAHGTNILTKGLGSLGSGAGHLAQTAGTKLSSLAAGSHVGTATGLGKAGAMLGVGAAKVGGAIGTGLHALGTAAVAHPVVAGAALAGLGAYALYKHFKNKNGAPAGGQAPAAGAPSHGVQNVMQASMPHAGTTAARRSWGGGYHDFPGAGEATHGAPLSAGPRVRTGAEHGAEYAATAHPAGAPSAGPTAPAAHGAQTSGSPTAAAAAGQAPAGAPSFSSKVAARGGVSAAFARGRQFGKGVYNFGAAVGRAAKNFGKFTAGTVSGFRSQNSARKPGFASGATPPMGSTSSSSAPGNATSVAQKLLGTDRKPAAAAKAPYRESNPVSAGAVARGTNVTPATPKGDALKDVTPAQMTSDDSKAAPGKRNVPPMPTGGQTDFLAHHYGADMAKGKPAAPAASSSSDGSFHKQSLAFNRDHIKASRRPDKVTPPGLSRTVSAAHKKALRLKGPATGGTPGGGEEV